MMMDFGMGWGIGWVWMLLFWLIPILLVLAAVKYLFSGKSQSGRETREDKDNALVVLEERYARGEINREEFIQKRDDLKRT
ncbi:MAG TPA: SHOCT domain-containing protein [Gammaproteobacteria bacterium]|nr:SHOCT domain-containing protein [Gammaproteobacteria bacterium]